MLHFVWFLLVAVWSVFSLYVQGRLPDPLSMLLGGSVTMMIVVVIDAWLHRGRR